MCRTCGRWPKTRCASPIPIRPHRSARRPAIKVWVDFGAGLGVKQSSAQITAHYTPDGLVGRQVLAVINFAPRKIGPFLSEILILGLPDGEGQVVLIGPDQPVPAGGRLY